MSEMGQFIVIDGLEGAGKSSAVEVLDAYLTEKGIPHIVTREPGSTRLSEEIRSLVLNHRDGEPINDLAELFLFLAARAQLVNTVIRPALERGEWVLCDRFTASTVAYQGYGRALGESTVMAASEAIEEGVWPNLTILLAVDPEVGLRRSERDKGESHDRFTAENLAFFKRCDEGFHHYVTRLDSGVVVDANQTQDKVLAQLKAEIDKRLLQKE